MLCALGSWLSSRRGFLKRPLAGLGNQDVLMCSCVKGAVRSVSRWGTDVRSEGEEMKHVLRGKGSLALPLGNREPPDACTGTGCDLTLFQAGSPWKRGDLRVGEWLGSGGKSEALGAVSGLPLGETGGSS